MRPLVVCVVAIAVLACSRVPPEAETAQRLIKRREFGAAETEADRGLSQHPRHPALWRAKIQAVMGQLDTERAVALYQRWARDRGAHDRSALRSMALTTLWQAVQVPSARVRVLAIQAIERLELEPLAREVAARIEDEDEAVAAAAAVALLRSQPGAPEVATQLVRSEEPLARAIAVEGIGRKVGAAARGDLLPALGDGDASVRVAAATAIGAMGQAADTPRLVALAARDGDGAVRAAALRALAGRAHEDIVDVAVRALGDAALEARLAAVDVLAATDRARLAPAVRAADLAVAVTAAAALGQRDGDVQAVVERAVAGPSWEVRAAALRALPRLAEGAWRADLAARGLGDADERARLAAAIALTALGDARGPDGLNSLCTSQDADVREAAVRAHRDVRVPGAGITAGLVAALADESAQVRVAAAETLLSILR